MNEVTATLGSASLGGRVNATKPERSERPLEGLRNRVMRASSILDEQTSLLADAKTNALNRMTGELPPQNEPVRDPSGPGRTLSFDGDIGELELAIMRLEATVADVVDRDQRITNRLTNIG